MIELSLSLGWYTHLAEKEADWSLSHTSCHTPLHALMSHDRVDLAVARYNAMAPAWTADVDTHHVHIYHALSAAMSVSTPPPPPLAFPYSPCPCIVQTHLFVSTDRRIATEQHLVDLFDQPVLQPSLLPHAILRAMTTATASSVDAHRRRLSKTLAAPLLADVLVMVVAHIAAAGLTTVMLRWSSLMVTVSVSSPKVIKIGVVAGYWMAE